MKDRVSLETIKMNLHLYSNSIFEILKIGLHGFPKKFSILMNSNAKPYENQNYFFLFCKKKWEYLVETNNLSPRVVQTSYLYYFKFEEM